MASPSGGRPPLKAAGCPQVVDLVDYAWNRLTGDEKVRIETHLRSGPCRQCQGWIDQARQLSPPATVSLHAAPATDSAQWQRQAFRDLENRLRALDEQSQ